MNIEVEVVQYKLFMLFNMKLFNINEQLQNEECKFFHEISLSSGSF